MITSIQHESRNGHLSPPAGRPGHRRVTEKLSREDMMKHANTVALMLAVAGLALVAMSGDRSYSQADNPNGAPNPYRLEENWAQLPAGRKMGSAIGVEVDKDGKSVWVFDRCGSNTCANSPLNP